MKSLVLLSTLVLSLRPFETIQFKRQHLPNLVKKDVIPLFPSGFVLTTFIDVDVGSNNSTGPQHISVAFDTGSSELWFPTSEAQACVSQPTQCKSLGTFNNSQSSTYHFKNDLFSVSYFDNTGASGNYFTDHLQIGGFTIANQTMGQGNITNTIPGVIGFGYPAADTPDHEEAGLVYPRFLSQLVSQGSINAAAFSVNINNFNTQGTLLIGAIDTNQFEGQLHVVPIQKSSEGVFDEYHVLLNVLAITDTQGNEQIFDVQDMVVLVDSGSEMADLPKAAFDVLVQSTNAVADESGRLIADCSLQNNPDLNIFISFGTLTNFSVQAPNIVTPAFDAEGNPLTKDDGSPVCQLPFTPWPNPDNTTLNIGQSILRPAYIVFDQTNNQIAFAQSTIPQAKKRQNGVIPIPSGGVLDIPGIAVFDPSAQNGAAVLPTASSVVSISTSASSSISTSPPTSVTTITSQSVNPSGQTVNILISNTIIINEPLLVPVVVTANGLPTTTFSAVPQIQTIGSAVIATQPCNFNAVPTIVNSTPANSQATAIAIASPGQSVGAGSVQVNPAVSVQASTGNASANVMSTTGTIFKGEAKRVTLSIYMSLLLWVLLSFL